MTLVSVEGLVKVLKEREAHYQRACVSNLFASLFYLSKKKKGGKGKKEVRLACLIAICNIENVFGITGIPKPIVIISLR